VGGFHYIVRCKCIHAFMTLLPMDLRMRLTNNTPICIFQTLESGLRRIFMFIISSNSISSSFISLYVIILQFVKACRPDRSTGSRQQPCYSPLVPAFCSLWVTIPSIQAYTGKRLTLKTSISFVLVSRCNKSILPPVPSSLSS
jgi:hypothetical protein